MAADTEGAWVAPVKIPIDNPTIVDPTDATRKIVDDRGLFVIHAVMMHTGRVLWFCGHVENAFYAPIAYVFDPAAPVAEKLRAFPFPAKMDLFCCHFVQLDDGRILVIGGSQQDDYALANPYHGSSGAKIVLIFDPGLPTAKNEKWVTTGKELRQGRWYPTAIMLGDGRALAVSGRRESGANPAPPNGRGIAEMVEVLAPPAFDPADLGADKALPIYPGLHLAPDGKVYTSHTTWGQEIAETPGQALTVAGSSGSWAPFAAPAPQPAQVEREEGMSVPLPVTLPRASSKGRVLVVGGGQAQTAANAIAVTNGAANTFDHQKAGITGKSAEIMNTTVSPPTWTAAPGALTFPRINGHCVLLPDATVLILGGHDNYKWQAKANAPAQSHPLTNPSLAVEIFTPGTGFTVGASMSKPRMYHSAALLLPDGRVLIAGGADPNENEPPLTYPAGWRGRRYPGGPPGVRMNGQPGSGMALNRKDYEMYEPPYRHNGAQPTITKVTPANHVQYGASFTITTPQAASIRHVAIMRPGVVTHHTDTEQRYVELEFTHAGNDLAVTMLPAAESAIAPPGFYMVWIVDDHGRPCQRARFLQLAFPPPKPAAKSSGICIVATVTLGSADAPEVRYLRALRDEVQTASSLGDRFIAGVNACYYSFSPQLASWLETRTVARAAVRDVIVRPGARAVQGADALTRRMRPGRRRNAALVALLTVEGVTVVAATPIVLLALAAHTIVGRRRARG